MLPGARDQGPGLPGLRGGGGELNPAETLSLHPTNAPGLPEASSRSRSDVAVGRGRRRVGLGRFLSVRTRKHEQMVWPRETGCQLLGVTEAARPTRWPQRAMPLRGPGGTRARPEAPPPEAHSTRRPRPPRRSAVLDSPLPGQPPGLRAPSRGVAGFCRGTVPGRGPAGGVGAGAKVEGSRKCTCLRKGAGPGSLGQRGRSPTSPPPLLILGLQDPCSVPLPHGTPRNNPGSAHTASCHLSPLHAPQDQLQHSLA